jgi:hypothetical protein
MVLESARDAAVKKNMNDKQKTFLLNPSKLRLLTKHSKCYPIPNPAIPSLKTKKNNKYPQPAPGVRKVQKPSPLKPLSQNSLVRNTTSKSSQCPPSPKQSLLSSTPIVPAFDPAAIALYSRSIRLTTCLWRHPSQPRSSPEALRASYGSVFCDNTILIDFDILEVVKMVSN